MTDPRQIATDIFHAALRAVDPEIAVARECAAIRDWYRTGGFDRLYVIGFGKAAVPMARALEAPLGDLVTDGVVVTKYGHAHDHRLERIRIMEAGHPLPDENGLTATEEIIRLARQADERTLVITLISGGGSALLVAPPPGITLEDKQLTTELLLKSGADIFELNTVRKHLSQVKGGRLAEMIRPATCIALILSDVIGDRLDVIASGPTAPDSSTFINALAVLARHRLMERVPAAVVDHLILGRDGMFPETPTEGNPCFRHVGNRIIGSLAIALDGAVQAAEALGMEVERIDEPVTGEAREAGVRLARRALEVRQGKDRTRPVCLISGGETTVTVTGSGTGGRNLELALAFAREIAGVDGITLLSAGTDGSDGPTDAAGAFCDGSTVTRGQEKRLDAAAFLAENDSYSYFREEGGLFVTGPTGTNVMDIQIVLIG